MRRIRRPKDKEHLFNLLTQKEHGEIFQTYKDVMIFAAALGMAKNKRKPIKQVIQGQSIDYSIFSRQEDNLALILMSGIYETEDVKILAPDKEDELLTIFEEYANAGMEIIQQKINTTGDNPLNAVLNLVHEAELNLYDEGDRDFSDIMKKLRID